MELDLFLYPHEVLGKISTPYTLSEIKTEKFRRIISAMFSVMYRARGVGLAAPQVGINRRLLIGNPNSRDTHDSTSFVLINPTIVHFSGEVTMMEGCLSIPDIFVPVTRPDVISVKTVDISGNEIRFEARGFVSRIIQHEIDHLDGLTFLDRMGKEERECIETKLQEHLERISKMRDARTLESQRAEAKMRKILKDRERKRRKKG
jgi:peptide deformylase